MGRFGDGFISTGDKTKSYNEIQLLVTENQLYILPYLFWFPPSLFSQRNKPEGHPCGWVGISWGASFSEIP